MYYCKLGAIALGMLCFLTANSLQAQTQANSSTSLNEDSVRTVVFGKFNYQDHQATRGFRQIKASISCLFGDCDKGRIDLSKDLYQLNNAFFIRDEKLFLKPAYKENLSSYLQDWNDRVLIKVLNRNQAYCSSSYFISLNPEGKEDWLSLPAISKNDLKGRENLEIGNLPPNFEGEFEVKLEFYQSRKSQAGEILLADAETLELKENFKSNGLHKFPVRALFSTKELLQNPAKQNNEHIIYFEQNKYKYDQGDLSELYDSLFGDFLIKQVRITAHSSIEGDSKINQRIQEKRAQTIVNALASLTGKDISSKIVNDNSYQLFKSQLSGTKFQFMAALSLEQMRDTLANNRTLRRELEPILAKQRFAKLNLSLGVDIESNKMASLLKVYREAVEEENVPTAFKAVELLNKHHGTNEKMIAALAEIPLELKTENAPIIYQAFINPEIPLQKERVKLLVKEQEEYLPLARNILVERVNQMMKIKSREELIVEAKSLEMEINDIAEDDPKSDSLLARLNVVNFVAGEIDTSSFISNFKSSLDVTHAKDVIFITDVMIKADRYEDALEISKNEILSEKPINSDFKEQLALRYFYLAAKNKVDIDDRNEVVNSLFKSNEKFICKLFNSHVISYSHLTDDDVTNKFCSSCQSENLSRK